MNIILDIFWLFQAHGMAVTDVCFCSHSNFATVSLDGSVRVWQINVRTGAVAIK